LARGVWTRRWLAISGGVLVNGLILGALVLIEEPPPRVEDAPVLLLDLERPDRQKSPTSRAAARSPAVSATAQAPKAPSSAPIVDGQAVSNEAAATPPAIDPAWRMDRKTIDRWRITEGVPEWGWGRYYRACKGLSSEHMTPDEKERCYAGWGGKRDRRPSPGFIGPIDETQWESPQPELPSRYEKEGPRKQRCRDYRRGRTPGFSERNLASTGSPPPSLREGGCF